MAEVKKRKRADASEASHKKKKTAKAAAAPPDITVNVASVLTPQVTPPIIAASPGLSVPAGHTFNAYSKTSPARPKRKKNRDPETPELLLHSPSHQTLDYTAREDKARGAGALKHYIGVFDPATGQLEVVEARKMVVRGVVRSQQAPEEALRPRVNAPRTTNLRAELGQEFGTRKAKKALQSVKENAIVPREGGEAPTAAETATLNSIKEAAAHIPTRDELQAVVDSAKPIPRGNYGASEIQDVYRPEELIGAETLHSIPVKDWQAAVKNGEAVSVRSRFVAHRINRVGASENPVERLRILRYLYLLVLFYLSGKPGKERGARRVPPRDKLREELAPAPDPVIDSIRRKFSDQGTIRKIHADLLVTHCCALACILDSFEVNTWDLKEDLKLDQQVLNMYFSEIGARVAVKKKSGSTEYVAKLALPLQFPKMKMNRARR